MVFVYDGVTLRDTELQSETQRPRQRHLPAASLLNGRGEEGGGVLPKDCSLGLAIILVTFVGLPMTATYKRA